MGQSEFLLVPALCLDFDGTIRRSKSGQAFIASPEDIELFPDVERVLWSYRRAEWLICGVTNQGGVAYGYRTPEQVEEENHYTTSLFAENPFHSIIACLSHPDGSIHPYNHRSLWRKPDYGMLAHLEWQALERGVVIDWDQSVVVGDRTEDQEMALRARVEFRWAWDFFGRERPNGQ